MNTRPVDIVGRWRQGYLRSNARYLQAVLGWTCHAIEHETALEQVLASLLSEPEFRRRSIRARRWQRLLRGVIADLENGERLSLAMRRLQRYLPTHFIPALATAEENNCVAAALPVLCEGIGVRERAQSVCRGAFAYPLGELIPLVFISSLVLIFIFPRVCMVSGELTGQYGLEAVPLLRSYIIAGDFIQRHFILFLLCLVATVAANAVFGRQQTLAGIREAVVFSLPAIGPLYRDLAGLELAQSMAGFLASGNGLLASARGSLSASRSPGVRARLRTFIDAVEQGAFWADAWERSSLGDPLQTWMVRNAAAREDPVSGFRSLTEWLTEQAQRHADRSCRWVETTGILLNTVIAGWFCLGVIQLFTGITMSFLDVF